MGLSVLPDLSWFLQKTQRFDQGYRCCQYRVRRKVGRPLSGQHKRPSVRKKIQDQSNRMLSSNLSTKVGSFPWFPESTCCRTFPSCLRLLADFPTKDISRESSTLILDYDSALQYHEQTIQGLQIRKAQFIISSSSTIIISSSTITIMLVYWLTASDNEWLLVDRVFINVNKVSRILWLL